MATQKLQVSTAIAVITSNDANVPFPALSQSGTNTSIAANRLINSSADFVTANVTTGDIVYNIYDQTAATVVEVLSATTLKLNADIFTATSKAYAVYKGGENDGCVLYIGVTGNLRVTTAGGNDVTFNAVPVGFFPVQVLKVWSSGTGASGIVGLF